MRGHSVPPPRPCAVRARRRVVATVAAAYYAPNFPSDCLIRQVASVARPLPYVPPLKMPDKVKVPALLRSVGATVVPKRARASRLVVVYYWRAPAVKVADCPSPNRRL